MSDKVSRALEERKKRQGQNQQNGAEEKKNTSRETRKANIDAALAIREQRITSNIGSIMSDISNRYDAVNKAYNDSSSALWGKSASEIYDSQRENMLAVNKLMRDIEAYRKYFGMDTDTVLSSLGNLKNSQLSIYNNAKIFSQHNSEEEYNNFNKSLMNDITNNRVGDITKEYENGVWWDKDKRKEYGVEIDNHIANLTKARDYYASIGQDTTEWDSYIKDTTAFRKMLGDDVFWGSFGSEKQYADYIAQQKNSQGLLEIYTDSFGNSRYTYDELNSIISEMEDGFEKEWLKLYAPTTMTELDYTKQIGQKKSEIANLTNILEEYEEHLWWVQRLGTDTAEYAEHYNRMIEIQQQYGSAGDSDIKNLLESAKADLWRLENDLKYRMLSKNEDFHSVSTAVPDDKTTGFGIGIGGKWFGKGDPVYDYINNIDNTKTNTDARAMVSGGSAPYAKYGYMNDDEIAIYNYLYHTEGKQSANDYLDYLEYDLNERSMNTAIQQAKYFTNKIPVLPDVLSTGGVLSGIVGYADALWQKASNSIEEAVTGDYAGPTDYNRGSFLPSVVSSTIRGQRAQNITDSTGYINLDPEKYPGLSQVFNGKSFGDVYQLGMSAGDSVAVMALTYAGVPAWVGSGLLAGNAATQGTLDAVSRGATEEQALWLGALNGAAEYIFEKYEIEGILKGISSGKLSDRLISALTEGFGEGATSVANLLSDAIIMAEKSDWQKNINKHIEKYADLPPEEARAKAEKDAFMEALIQVGWDVVGGALMGYSMSTGGAAISNTVSQNAQYRSDGSSIMGVDGGTDALMNLANEVAGVSGSKKLSKQIDKTTNKTTEKNVGKLFNAIQSSNSSMSQADIAKSLERKGININKANAIAEALVASYNGNKLSDKQTKLLQSVTFDQKVRNAISDIVANPQSTMGQRNQKVTKFATDIALGMLAKEAGVNLDEIKNETEGNVTTIAEKVSDSSYEVSENGTDDKTIQISSGKEVIPQKITSINNGKAIIQTDNGKIDAEDIAFGNADMDLLWRSAVQFSGITPAGANGVIRAYQRGIPVTTYLTGAAQEFKNGYHNLPSGGKYADKLTPSQRTIIYDLGQKAAGENVAKEQARIEATNKKAATEKSSATVKKGGVYYGYEGRTISERVSSGKALNTKQSVGVEFAERLAKSRGITFYFYESYINENGDRVYKDKNGNIVKAENGFYDPSDGSIHIDLNAGYDGKGTVLFTISHELVHFIKDWSPKHFKQMANILMKEYRQKNVPVDTLVKMQQANAQEHGRELSYDEAYEEVIADSMETILADGKVMELMRDIEKADKSLSQKIKEFFQDIVQLLKDTINAYRGVHPDTAEGTLVSQMDDLITELQQVFAEGIYEAGNNFRKAEKNTTGEGGVKYAAKYDYTKSFAKQIDDYKLGKIPKGDTLLLGGTPKVYQSIGFTALPMTMNTTHIDYALYGTKDTDHFMGETALKQLPQSLEKPIAVFLSKTHGTTSVIALLNFTVNGKQAVAPIVIDGYGKTNSVEIDSNAVTSAYGKTSAIDQLYHAAQEHANGKFALLYANKKEALSLLQRAGHQLSGALIPHDGFYHSIREKASPVKPKFNDVTETQQFRKWFGDWLKHPKTASKIVNADGTPKVMYHGSPAQFTIFDKKKARSSGAYGSGFYFTDSQSHAATYGQQYSVYLNIRNPLQYGNGTLSKAQMHKFLEAVAENEDYSIENYGTYDVDSIVQNIMGAESKVDAFKAIQDISATAIGDMVDATELFNQVNGTRYDGIITATETVAFYPEQIKSATDNVGTFDGNNPDIRYSVRKSLNTSVADLLQQENEKLKEDVQHLKDLLKLQRTVTGGTKFTKSSVEAAARMLKNGANARGDTAELAKILNNFYEGIATDKELSWESVREMAKPAVDWLQSHTEVKPERSEYAKDILSHLRTSRIYLDDVQKNEVAYRYGSYDAYRKMMMGSIILAKEGSVSLDSKWQELSAMYPDVFDVDTTATDMPEALIEAISRMRNSDTTVLEYEYNKDLIAQELLREVYDSYWKVSTLRTFADSKQREINKLKAMHYQRLDKLRANNAAQIEQMKADHRATVERINSQHRQQMEKQQAELRQQYKASKKKAIETRDKREAREKLQKLVLDTVKWITYPSKTDVKCPDILKQPYADFLNSIDLSSQRLANGGDPTKNDLRLTNAMSSLATALDKVLTSQDPTQDATTVLDTGYLDLPANFVEKLRDMTEEVKEMMGSNEYVVNRMPAEEVRKLTQMIRTLNHAIKEVSTLYANLRFANIEALGDNTMSFVDALGEIEKAGGMKDFVQWDNALPYYAFRRFGEGGESIFEGLMDAQDKLAFLAQKIFDFQEKTWTGKEAKAWSEDTHTIDLPDGETLNLTTADAMSIYCLSRRQQGLQHLLVGGARIIGLQKGSKKAKDSRSLLTVKDIDTIISSLTDRQKQVADTIQEFMSTVCSEWGNEISMKRFLTKEFNEKFYFPIESNDENLSTKDPAAQQSDLFRLLNISATKPIDPRANNEVIIRNIFDVFSGHASDMARLNAYGMALLDYMKWLNYREKTVNEDGQIKVRGVRKSMERAYGAAAKSYVLNLVKDVNGRPSDGGLPNFYTRMLKNAKTAMVGNSLRVATLQFTSYARAALVLSPKNLALGFSKLPQIKKAKKYCGIALWKSFGFYDTNISRSIEEQIKGVTDVRQKLIELSLKGAEWGDAITWGYLWNACEYDVAATKQYKVGTEEFYQAVGKKLREVVYRTQVVDSTLTRSQMMRGKDNKAKELSSFMSEPTLSANILMDAAFQFNAEKRRTGSAKIAWKKTGSYITKAIAVYSIGQLAAAFLEGLWDAWRDDDDEEFSEKFWDAFIKNLILDILPFNKIPILSEFAEAALSLLGLGYFSSDDLSSTALSQTVSAAKSWSDVLNGKTSETTYSAIYKTIRAISSFLGVSISGVMREGVDLWNNTAGAYDSTWKIRTWDLSNTDLASEALDAIIEGNDRQANSIRAEFSDDDSYQSAMRTAIKDRYAAGEIDYNTAIQYLVKYGGMEEDDAYWRVDEWMYEIETGDDYDKYNEFFTAVETGKNLKAVITKYTDNGVSVETLYSKLTSNYKKLYIEMSTAEKANIKGYLLNAMTVLGKTREEAEETVRGWEFESKYGFTYADREEAYKTGKISASELKNILMTVGGKTADEADLQIQVYDWEEQGYDGVTAAAVRDYNNYCAGYNVPKDIYLHIRSFANDTKNDVDSSGKTINYSAMKKIMAEINSQYRLTSSQKDAIARSLGWSEKNIQKYKTW